MRKMFLFIAAVMCAASMSFAQSWTSGACTANLDNNGVMTVSGNGAMADCPYYDESPWYNQREAIKSLIIQEGVTTIGQYAFCNCKSLTSVSIPSSVTAIKPSAFDQCTALLNIVIASPFPTIGSAAFQNVPNVPYPGNPSWGAKCYNGYVDGYVVYENASQKVVMACSTEAQGAITIVEGATDIYGAAFSECSKITSISLPSTVDTIGANAFYKCSSMTTVNIPEAVTELPFGAFMDCSSLTNIIVPEGMTILGQYAFRDCRQATTAYLPSTLTTIEQDAFWGCTEMTDVYCLANPDNLTWTDGSCNDFKPNRETRCHVPYQYINGYNSKWKTGNPSTDVNLTFLGEDQIKTWASGECLVSLSIGVMTVSGNGAMADYSGSGDDLPWILYRDEVTSIVIEEGVTHIGDQAFYGFGALASVTIPASVRSIGDYALYTPSALVTLTIPEGVTEIGIFAFAHAEGLKTVYLPSTLTIIEQDAFYDCTVLSDVYCAANPDNLEWNDGGYDDFMADKATRCHVIAEYLDGYNTNWNTGNEDTDVNITFVGDYVPQGIESIVDSRESRVESRKILHEGNLFILRDGKIFNAQGARVK